MAMAKRYRARPSELLGVQEPYAAYCIDEVCMYMLCRIEQDGKLPRAMERMSEPTDNTHTVERLMQSRSVARFDRRLMKKGDNTE